MTVFVPGREESPTTEYPASNHSRSSDRKGNYDDTDEISDAALEVSNANVRAWQAQQRAVNRPLSPRDGGATTKTKTKGAGDALLLDPSASRPVQVHMRRSQTAEHR